MKTAFALVVAMFAVFSAAQTPTAQPLMVSPERIQRVEILYFPERVLVRAALTPQRLEQLYQYKLEIKDVRESPEWKRLTSALSETSVETSQRSYDHRTAVLLFDRDGRRIYSVYFDQFGTGGTINGDSGAIKGDLYRWAKSMLKGVAD